ncbi:YrzI family small protein [Bacillus andreraoultii]|nr:YrzI family small protein [Bacillus andreraoultii]
MTINILFFSITLKRREFSLEEELHNEQVEKLYEKNRNRMSDYLG